jgi:hypothetical protein
MREEREEERYKRRERARSGVVKMRRSNKGRNVYLSSAHSFSFLIWASSSGVKSFWMLKS